MFKASAQSDFQEKENEDVVQQDSHKVNFIPNGKTFPYRLKFNVHPEFNSIPKNKQVDMYLVASIHAPTNKELDEYRAGVDLIFDLELGDANWTQLKHANIRNTLVFLLDSLQITDQVGLNKVNLSILQKPYNEYGDKLFLMNLRSKEFLKKFIEKIKSGPPYPFHGIISSIVSLRKLERFFFFSVFK